jgi:hypothetical protein
MRLTTLVLVSLGAIVLVYLFARYAKEGFGGGGGLTPSLTISWQPPANYPFPTQLQYVWGLCYNQDMSPGHVGSASVCSNLAGKDPSQWPISGTTSSTSVTFNNTNCALCVQGQILTFMLMAQDTKSGLKSPWVSSSIDLTSTNPSTVTATDGSGRPIYIGATSVVVTVTSATPFPAGAEGYFSVSSQLPDLLSKQLPLTISGATATATFPWTTQSVWLNPPIPGQGIISSFTITVDIYEASGSQPVSFYGATNISPASPPVSSPSAVSWSLQ